MVIAMAFLDISSDQILDLIQQLSLDDKRRIFEALREEITASSILFPELDEESRLWLEAEMTEELPEYDWGPEGIPQGLPIRYIPGRGVMIIGTDEAE
jgi:hypothetical protein